MLGSRHPYLQHARIEADLGGAARRDPIGHRLHTYFGVLWCFSLGLPTTAVEIASIPLIVYFLLRTPNIWRTWGSFAVQPLTIAVGLWIAWQALALSWSSDPRQGLEELAANRWVWAMWMLWPVMDRRGWFIAAICLGFFCGNLSQVGHEIGRRFDLAWLTWPRLTDRNSGWWDPVVGGSLLVGALGLHLPAAVTGRGRWRWLGIGGTLVTLLAIGATGTRGAWLAGAGLLTIAMAVAVARLRPWHRAVIGSGLALAAVFLVLVLAMALKGDSIRRRLDAAYVEIDAAVQRGDYSTDTGARVQMGIFALSAVRDQPLRGQGAGSFRTWMTAQVAAEGHDPAQTRLHAHAHSAPLHIAATTGLVGLALAGLVGLIALHGAFAGLGRPAGSWAYSAGPGLALVGLGLAGLFDPVHLNAQTAALLYALLALSLWPRPRES